MRSAKSQRELVKPPVVVPENWQGEILDGYTFSFGQAVQDGPKRQSVEFSYIGTSAVFTPPQARLAWSGVIMIVAPTPMRSLCPKTLDDLQAPNVSFRSACRSGPLESNFPTYSEC